MELFNKYIQYILIILFLCFTIDSLCQINPNHNYVKGYFKKDGTYVKGHYKTMPNNNMYDNFSTKGNVNPYTGELGTIIPKKSSNNWKVSYTTQKKLKVEFVNAMNFVSNDFYDDSPKFSYDKNVIKIEGLFLNFDNENFKKKKNKKQTIKRINTDFLEMYFNIFSYYLQMDSVYDKMLLSGFNKIKITSKDCSYSLKIDNLKTKYDDFLRKRKLLTNKIDSLYELANIKFKSNNFYEVISLTSEIININNNYKSAYILRGLSNFEIEKYSDATLDIDNAIRIDSTDYLPFYIRGKIKIHSNKFEEAYSDLTKAIEINPNNMNSYHHRAYLNFVVYNRLDLSCSDWFKANELGHYESLEYYNKHCK